jgi:hypothetical protein
VWYLRPFGRIAWMSPLGDMAIRRPSARQSVKNPGRVSIEIE